jgi:iron complex outermembrane receptor protein
MSIKLSLKKSCTLIVLAFFTFASVYAQQLRVSGKVTDASTNETLPGVNVAVKGSGTGTATDGSGNYSISVNRGSVLVFSFLGYAPQEISVGTATTINVALQPEATQLGEVVVTALGIKKEARTVGYSVQKINAPELTKAAPPSIAHGLMGKAAGVNVTQPNGIEGGSQRIIIRGNNSLLGNNQPLIIVDGIQMGDGRMGLNQSNGSGYNIRTGSYSTPDLGGAQTDWGNPLNFLNN